MPTKEPKVPIHNEGQEGPTALERLTQVKNYVESFLAWCEIYAPEVFVKVQPVVTDTKAKIEVRLNKFPNTYPKEEHFFELIKRYHPDFPFELFGRWKEECNGESATSFEPPLPQVEGNEHVVETEEPDTAPVVEVAPPAQVSEPAVEAQQPSGAAIDANESAVKEFDRTKWMGMGLTPEAAYEKYRQQVIGYAHVQINSLPYLEIDERYVQGRAIIERIYQRILEAALHEGPIKYERSFKLDSDFRKLNLSSQGSEGAKPKAILQEDEGKANRSTKDFSKLGNLLGVAPIVEHKPAASALPGGTASENGGGVHQSAINEPPATIGAVSKVVPPNEMDAAPLSPEAQAEKEKAAVEELNEIKTKIEEQRRIIRDNQDTLNKKGVDKKAARDAVKVRQEAKNEIDNLHNQALVAALDIADEELLAGLVKPADVAATKLYERKIPKKKKSEIEKMTPEEREKLPEERKNLEKELMARKELTAQDVDANFEAVRRRREFLGLLTAKGVGRGMAGELYEAWGERAGYAVWLRGALEEAKTDEEKANILKDPSAIKVLEWEGIEATEPEAVLLELVPIVDEYKTIPPKVERTKPDAGGATEYKSRRITQILKAMNTGEVAQDHGVNILRSLAKDAKTQGEQAEAQAALKELGVSLEGEEKEKNGKLPSLREHVLEMLRGEHSETVPWSVLQKYSNDPEIAKRATDRILQAIKNNQGETVPWEVLETYSKEPEIAAFMKAFEATLVPSPVTIAPDEFGVLLLHTWKNKIPEGVQIGYAIGGGSTPKTVEAGDEDDASKGETLRGVWLDQESFGKQCSVSSVNVNADSNGHCQVYVHFDVDKRSGNAGLHRWGKEGNAYGPFLRSLFGERYKNVRVSRNGKKVSLRFSDERVETPAKTKTKIIFAAAEDKSKDPTLAPDATNAAPVPVASVAEKRLTAEDISVQGYKVGQEVWYHAPGMDEPIQQKILRFSEDQESVFFEGGSGIGVLIREISPTREKQVSPEKPKQVTDEARALVAQVTPDGGGIPLYPTENLKRIAKENDIPYDENTTPNEIIDRIRERIKEEDGVPPVPPLALVPEPEAKPTTPPVLETTETEKEYPKTVEGFFALKAEMDNLRKKLNAAAGNDAWKAYDVLDAQSRDLDQQYKRFFSEIGGAQPEIESLLQRRTQIIERLSQTKLSEDGEVMTSAVPYDEMSALIKEQKELEENIVRLFYGSREEKISEKKESKPHVIKFPREDVSALTEVVGLDADGVLQDERTRRRAQYLEEMGKIDQEIPDSEKWPTDPLDYNPFALKEKKKRIYVERHFPAAMEVIKKMEDPSLPFSEFQELGESYRKANEAAGVPHGKRGLYEQVSWHLPNGREIRFSWSIDEEGNHISWGAGPNDRGAGAGTQEGESPLNHVARQFEKKFGITEDMLQGVEGFKELSEGQQLLVLNELERYSVARVKADALKDYREKHAALGGLTEEEKRRVAKGGWWRKVAVGISQIGKKQTWQRVGMTLMKTKEIADREKELAEKMANGEVDQKEFLAQLVLQAKEGPGVEIVGGKPELQFLSETAFEGALTPEEKARVTEFNRVASKFAHTPHSWKERGASSKEEAKYSEAEGEYNRMLMEMLELKRSKLGDEGATIDTIAIDKNITFQQFFNTHPETEERLANIKDQSIWGKWALATAQTRGGIMLAGGAIRSVATFAASQLVTVGSLFVAAPIAGAVMGGYMGRKRAHTELEEREMLAKAGVKDTSAEALNIVPAANLAEKIYRLVKKIEAMPDAADLSDEDRKKRVELIDSLAARCDYTKEKIDKGLVNFGGASEGIKSRYELLKALSAGVATSAVDQEWDLTLRDRLRQFLDFKEEAIEEREVQYVMKQVKTAATYGAVFGAMGAGVADILHAPLGEKSVILDAAQNIRGHYGSGSTVVSENPDSYDPEAFTPENYDKNIPTVLRRTPSAEELAALRFTGFGSNEVPANMDQHHALIAAMSDSKTPLTHEQIVHVQEMARFHGEAGQELRAMAASASPASSPEASTLAESIYTVKSGDNFTKILKEANIPEFKDLSPQGQENAIQNLLKSLSADEKAAIGLGADPDKLIAGQTTLDLNKVTQLLHEKQIGGESLLERAGHLGEQTINASTPPAISVTPEQVLPNDSIVEPEKYVGQDENGVILGQRIPTLIPENIAELNPVQRASLWEQLSDENKLKYVGEAIPRHMHEDISNIFVKGPFEEWPKEWLALRGRDAAEFLSQTEKTAYTPLPGSTQPVPPGYEWSAASKIQQYLAEHGLTSEKGFTPYEKETVEDFLVRTMGERILREGPLPWLN